MGENKKAKALALGISRSSLYYSLKQPIKDWRLKQDIERALREHPGYGYRRAARHLQVNKKRCQRVMKLFGIKARRRRGRKYRKIKAKSVVQYPNLLINTMPLYPSHIWASDFTEIRYHKTKLFLATIIDLYSREIVGWALMTNHAVSLLLQALFSAINHRVRSVVFHSDNGREYVSQTFVRALTQLGIQISRSKPGCPWENGYQEGFYSQFKIDLGDPNRFKTLGELVYEIHRLIHDYNKNRIHSAIKMPPSLFAQRHQQKLLETVSEIWGS